MAFNGQKAEIPVGWSGLTGTHNMGQVKADELLIAKNVTYENGTLQKEGGATLYGTSPGAAAIIGGCDYWPLVGQQRMILLTSTALYKDSGTGTFPVTLASGLNPPTAMPMFLEAGKEGGAANRKLFITTGSNQLKVLNADGATVANVATPPADWATQFPMGIFMHLNRVWGYGGADRHRLYYSTIASHEDWTTSGASGAGTIAVYPGEADGITASVSYKGHVIVFKSPTGIYDVDTTSNDITQWTVKPITRALGCAGQGLIMPLDNDILFVDKTGNVHQVSAVQEFGDFGLFSTSDMALMTTYIRENVNLNRLAFAQSFTYAAKREIHIALSDKGSSSANTRRLVMDLNAPPKFRWRWSDWGNPNAIWLRRDSQDIPRPVWGATDGKVRLADRAAKDDLSAGYEARFKTPHLDLGYIDPLLSSRMKNWKFLEIVIEPQGNWTLYADIYCDGKFQQTVLFNLGTVGSTLGSFLLDTDTLGTDVLLNKRKRITGQGRRISIEGYNANPDEDFSISKMILHYTVSDERTRNL